MEHLSPDEHEIGIKFGELIRDELVLPFISARQDLQDALQHKEAWNPHRYGHARDFLVEVIGPVEYDASATVFKRTIQSADNKRLVEPVDPIAIKEAIQKVRELIESSRLPINEAD